MPLRGLSGLFNPTRKVKYSGLEDPDTTSRDGSSMQAEIRESIHTGRVPFTTWRIGAFVGAGSSLIVLLINIGAAIYIDIRQKKGEGLFKGNCDAAKRWSTAFHVLINVFSTLLLGASNYCTQILTSPTRKDVDKAHKDGRWLDVGVVSLRNLFRMNWERIVLATILALSSLPLHLLYNSTVFLTLQANVYSINAISQAQSSSFMGNLSRNGTPFTVLGSAACLNIYTENFLTKFSNITLVFNVESSQLPALDKYENIGIQGTPSCNPDQPGVSFQWICNEWQIRGVPPYNVSQTCKSGQGIRYLCSQDEILDTLNKDRAWNVQGAIVQQCIVTTTEEQCEVNFQRSLIIAVIISNLAKVLAILATILLYGERRILTTIGDACATFLDQPDEYSKGMCFITKHQIKYNGFIWLLKDMREPRKFRRKPARWWKSVGPKRWGFTIAIGTACLAVASGYLGVVVKSLNRIQANLSTVAFGQADVRTFAGGFLNRSYFEVVLLANAPQLVISFFYLLYNGIFTTMAISREVDRFSKERKHLRVSEPTGEQRSSFFLQLPYRFGLPLMAISALTHWLFSQSLFVVSIIKLGGSSDGIRRENLGYSPLALLLSIVVFATTMLASLAVGFFFKIEGVVPAVGSSSAAISAICHRPEADTAASTAAVMWGVPSIEDLPSTISIPQTLEDSEDGREGQGGREKVAHCCLTSFPVTLPEEGSYYQ